MSQPEDLKYLCVLNLERTIADNVFTHGLATADYLGLTNPEASPHSNSANIGQQKLRLLGSFAGKTTLDLETFTEHAAKTALTNVAPFALLLMEDEYQSGGSQIVICSSTVPQPLVEAYAIAIENSYPNIRVQWAIGRPLIKKETNYTGEPGSMLKKQVLTQLAENENLIINLMADSFKSAAEAIKLARRPLLVNPEKNLEPYKLFQCSPHIIWDLRQPNLVYLRHPFDSKLNEFDLNDENDRLGLLRGLDNAYDALLEHKK